MNKVKETKKRKGFTLIELIAVIAILAILGAILVPRILGYRAKAERSNIQTSAKEMVNAIQSYNADKEDSDGGSPTQGERITNGDTVSGAIPIVNEENGKDIIATGDTDYGIICNGSTTVGKLVTIANGNFTLSGSGSSMTITVTGATGDIDQ